MHIEINNNLKFISCLAAAALPGMASARAANPAIAVNEQFLTDTRLTSALLVAGPPEVAREIAIVDSAMFDAASGSDRELLALGVALERALGPVPPPRI